MSRIAALRLRIVGRVQGVGFREAMVDAAEQAGVVGWVRNTRDGAVEAFVQGSADAIDGLVRWCRRGPPVARVASVEAEVVDADPALTRFERRPTG